MLIPIALVVFLLVTTAIIAPWSDNLGKKLGKKRVSVFGLRPRTSATVLTIASSWGIMFFTLGALLLTVRPLSHALLHYESEREQAQKDTAALKKTVVALKDDVQSAQNELKTAKDETANYRNQATSYKDQATTFQNNALKFQNQATEAQSNLQKAKRGEEQASRAARAAQRQQQRAVAALSGAQRALGSSQSQLSQTRADLQRNQEQVRGAKSNLDSANVELKQRQEQVKAAQEQVKAAQAQVKSVNTQLKIVSAVKDKAQAAAFKASGENLKLESQRNRLQSDVASLESEKQQAIQEKEQALLAANQFGQIAQGLAYEGIILPVNQTLAERRFDATRDSEQIARQLRFLIDVARDTVANPKTGLVPKAQFVVRARLSDPTTGKNIDLNEDEAVQFYAKALSSADVTVSARLVSAFNYPDSTTIIVSQFEFVPIRTVYVSRENIAEVTIDTSKSESAVFRQLNDLVETARRDAVKRGARPPLSPVEQNFFDGDTGQKLLDALREVRGVGHSVPVRIVAARDLDSAEPLQVRFLVGDETT